MPATESDATVNHDRIMDTVPALRRRTSVTALPGGTGHHTFRVQTQAGDTYAVRIPGLHSRDRGVDWSNELVNLRLAATAGVAPDVVAADPETGFLVTRFIDGSPMVEADLRDQGTLRELAVLLRRLHNVDGGAGRVDLTATLDEYLEQVRHRGLSLPQGFEDHAPRVRQLLGHLAERPEPRVLCHNDVNGGNVMRSDGRLWLIDFEYSAAAEPSFELGNLISESMLNDRSASMLVDTYWQQEDEQLRARARAWSVTTGYAWLVWSTVQASLQPASGDALRARAACRYGAVAPWLVDEAWQHLVTELVAPNERTALGNADPP